MVSLDDAAYLKLAREDPQGFLAGLSDEVTINEVQRLQHLYGYDSLNCYTTNAADLDDDLRRSDKREVILKDRLKAAAVALNLGNSVGENHPYN